jgi:hypothetical protein
MGFLTSSFTVAKCASGTLRLACGTVTFALGMVSAVACFRLSWLSISTAFIERITSPSSMQEPLQEMFHADLVSIIASDNKS